MSETKLLPCPFCGGETTIRTIDAHTHILKLSPLLPDCIGETFIECKNCTCAMSGQTESETIKAWNTRKPIERIKERLIDATDNLTGTGVLGVETEFILEVLKEEGGLND